MGKGHVGTRIGKIKGCVGAGIGTISAVLATVAIATSPSLSSLTNL